MKISIGISPAEATSVISSTGGGAIFSKSSGSSFSGLTLTINALAYGMFSTPGKSRYAGASGDASLFYNLVFPRDFVTSSGETTTISTDVDGVTIDTDPFNGYRNLAGIINTPMRITIQIPEGMKIGGNSHGSFVEFNDIADAWESNHPFFIEPTLGTSHPKSSLTKSTNSYFYYAMADPSFMIDFNSSEVTNTTIQDTIINIEVSGGQVVGAGGFGGYGNIQQDNNAYTTDLSSGGGGGGQGLHPDLTSSNDSDGNTWSLYNHDNASTQFVGSQVVVTPRTLGGQGGRSGSYVDQSHVPIFSGNIPPAANGGFGTFSAIGGGGAGGGITLIQTTFAGTSIVFGGHGGWGGSAFYFRSNTFSSTPLTGTAINITATANGIVAGGGGGGAGGMNSIGRNGGLFGEKGVDQGSLATNGRGGLGGAALFWNTSNVACSNTFTLNDSGVDEAKIVGRDINMELTI